MKKVMMAFATVCLLASCGEAEAPAVDTPVDAPVAEMPKYGSFGDVITEDGALAVADFVTALDTNKTWEGKISTKINSCCQTKGCWMKVDLGNGEEMRVSFKDYGFFVPKDAADKPVIMEGRAFYDTVSVDMLKHYAMDAGKTQEEQDAITEPEFKLAFEADGVLIEGAIPMPADAEPEHDHADHDHDHSTEGTDAEGTHEH